MAARPGEENVATLFGDVHYFYAGPEVKPRHERFDKCSYVYLFENASERRCRIEIANKPGMPEQDAFDGFLDQTHVRYSYKHHCMVSLKVADSVQTTEWHLPAYDARNGSKYYYKLHSLDVYFWTHQDALQFVNGVRRVLPPSQVDVLDEPAPWPLSSAVSSVVQQLEAFAVTDSRYRLRATSSSVAPNLVMTRAAQDGSGSTGMPLPPPPPLQQPHTATGPTNFAPMAYNPAAPAAPETVRPREKTPPLDDGSPDPLALAMAYDGQAQAFSPGPIFQGSGPEVAGHGDGTSTTVVAHPVASASPYQHQTLQRATTMPVQAQMQMQPLYDGKLYSTPPMATSRQPGVQQPGPPATAAPPYNYAQNSRQGVVQQPSHEYSIHNQIYRPTETAMGPRALQYSQSKQEPRGRLEENAAKLERSVTGMLRKFEKKFG